MRKNDLIKKLKELPGNPIVVLFDERQNMSEAESDGSGYGIYVAFKLEKVHSNRGNILALTFENDDYSIDGVKNETP